jgi:hypothetical protein
MVARAIGVLHLELYQISNRIRGSFSKVLVATGGGLCTMRLLMGRQFLLLIMVLMSPNMTGCKAY